MMKEKQIAKLIEHRLRLGLQGERVVKNRILREGLRVLWNDSDLTAGEICDAFDLRMDQLSKMLENECDPNPGLKANWWSENIKAGLPLFIPVKIKGI